MCDFSFNNFEIGKIRILMEKRRPKNKPFFYFLITHGAVRQYYSHFGVQIFLSRRSTRRAVRPVNQQHATALAGASIGDGRRIPRYNAVGITAVQ